MTDLGTQLIELTYIKINRQSNVPAWKQITCSLAGQVARRHIKVGEYTWSLRILAQLIGMSESSTAKAIKILKSRGIVDTDRRIGVKVGKNVTQEAEKILDCAIQDLITVGQQMKVGKTDLAQRIAKAWPQ